MTRPIHILLVEDNAGDVRLTIEALKESRLPNTLDVVNDGVEALDYLRTMALPDLILLDLNLPRRSGREVLTEIKTDPVLRRIPVMVLSTSRSKVAAEAGRRSGRDSGSAQAAAGLSGGAEDASTPGALNKLGTGGILPQTMSA